MAFNCNNQTPASTCGKYVVPYIENMGWISEGLLDIINQNILNQTLPLSANNITGSTGDTTPLCECYPICTGSETTECVSTGDAVVFNCITWEGIKKVLIDSSEDSATDPAYIPLLIQTIKCFLNNITNINYGIAAQLERFLCLAESLNTRLDSVCCNNKCPDLVGDLLCLLMQILTKLISAVSKAATLMYYSGCDINPVDGNKVIASFMECMACDFVNDLCELEKLITEVSALVVGFATCDMQKCTPCYTAPSVPRQVRPMCPSNTQSYANPYMGGYPYQSSGGCGCKK